MFNIQCTVSGGVTGFRQGLLKNDNGVIDFSRRGESMKYYDMVVAVARIYNNPRIGFKQVLNHVRKITNSSINENNLKTAWEEFRTAGAPRIVYSAS